MIPQLRLGSGIMISSVKPHREKHSPFAPQHNHSFHSTVCPVLSLGTVASHSTRRTPFPAEYCLAATRHHPSQSLRGPDAQTLKLLRLPCYDPDFSIDRRTGPALNHPMKVFLVDRLALGSWVILGARTRTAPRSWTQQATCTQLPGFWLQSLGTVSPERTHENGARAWKSGAALAISAEKFSVHSR